MATRLNLSVTEVDDDSISIENNTSDVLVVLEIITDGGTYNQSGDTSGYISLDGVQIKNLNGAPVYKNTKTELYRGTHTVKHNADGSKSITVKAAFDVNTSVRWIYAEQTLALTTIPRASVLQVPEFTLGAQGTMAVSKYVEGYTHTLEYTFGTLSGVIVEKSDATELEWTPPLEEFAWQIPDDVEGYGTLTLTTYNRRGGEIGNNKYPFKVLLPADVIPTAELTVKPVSDTVPDDWGVAVKGRSRLHYAVQAQGIYGSAIDTYVFTFAGQTVNGQEGETALLTQAGSFVPQAVVTDSRGRMVTVELAEVTVHEYSVPSIKESRAYRSDSEQTEQSDGTYATVMIRAECSSCGGNNSVTVRMRRRSTSGAWSGYAVLTNGVAETISGFSEAASYEVELSAIDTLGEEKAVSYAITTDAVAFNLKNGGDGAAFGKYAEKSGVLECAWDAEFGGNVKAEGTVTAADIVIGGRSLLDLLHPVGSYYWSDDATSPATLFGGTWVKVEGRFLLGSGGGYSVGDTGGETEHTLTVDELAAHNHLSMKRTQAANDWAKAGTAAYGMTGGNDSSNTAAWGSSNTGGSLPHNNMPPYYTTNIWRRTA